jgi:thioredoxin reductase (NADPH)
VYDAVIVGGGPAGLSAAVYLGRFLRSTVVIDSGRGRSTGPQLNENYLGFPRGVRVARLRDLGRKQAERFGVRFIQGTVATVARRDRGFTLAGDCGEWDTRALIIATGVTDIWPSFPHVERYVGASLFWCITCDGFRTRGRRTVLIGATDEAATTACQFLTYTDKLTFIAAGAGDEHTVAPESLDMLREHGIEVVEGAIERVSGARGQVRAVTAGGRRIPAGLLFSLLGAVPNAGLAAQAGVLLNEHGYVRIDREQRTNVPGVYAAGDITGPYAHQVASAVHEGAMAAQSANYDLYADFQRD